VITQIQKNLENNIYKELKTGGVGTTVVTKCPNQSIEELATILTNGLMMSSVGNVINVLDNETEGFGIICKGAFREAMLRVLSEAKE